MKYMLRRGKAPWLQEVPLSLMGVSWASAPPPIPPLRVSGSQQGTHSIRSLMRKHLSLEMNLSPWQALSPSLEFHWGAFK